MKLLLSIWKYMLLVIVPVALYFSIFMAYYYAKGFRIRKGTYKYIGYGSKLKRLFVDFPSRLALDMYTRDPDYFKPYGVHIIAGEQGSGKSITLTYMLNRFQKMYPRMIIKSNYGFADEVQPITHWRDIVDSQNGIYGEIDVLDEVQNWFNSLQSKDFPPEMMQEITQQRKQRKCIFGTAQVFGRISKPIREQATYIYKPLTLFGCLTIVRKYKPKVSSNDGALDELKLRQVFFFVHSDEIRSKFDTYRKIVKMSSDGFKPYQEQIRKNDLFDNFLTK